LSEQDSQDPQVPEPEPLRPELWRIFLLFLRVGTVAYGGAWAVVAVIDDYVVERYKWLDRHCMVRGISLISMLPGAAAGNITAYVGYRLHGVPGAIIAVSGLMLPSAIAMMTLTLIYFKFGDIAASQSILLGVQSAAVGIIIAAGWRIGQLVFRDALGPTLALASFLLCAFLQINMVIPLIFGGALGVLYYMPRLKEAGK
jgi:chromate transporter